MSFDPANPSKQVTLVSTEPATYTTNGHSDELDATGFRFLVLGVNVPGGALPVPPAGSTIEIDGLGPDGLWYQIQPPMGVNAIGQQLIRPYGVFPDHVRVAWTLPGAGAFGFWLIGQS
jgi:hypothetical protein